jgi:hypothetical protein
MRVNYGELGISFFSSPAVFPADGRDTLESDNRNIEPRLAGLQVQKPPPGASVQEV